MKKLNVKSITEKLIPAATIALGFASAKVVPLLVSKVYKPKEGLTNTIVGASEIVAGVLLSTMKNKHLSNVGLGIAVSGLHTFLSKPVEDALTAAGLNGVKYMPNYGRMAGSSIGCNEAVRQAVN